MSSRHGEVGPGQLTLDEGRFADPELKQVDTPTKLEILLADSRARFLPATNTEKNEAVSLLDYIHNPVYKGGVRDHLFEIYQRRIKDTLERGHSRSYGAIQGKIAVQSVLYEYGDFYANAQSSVHNLRTLATMVDDCMSPNVTLLELFREHETTAGAPEFVRYIGQQKVMRRQNDLGFDPLLARERKIPTQHGKNKIVEDIYTASEPAPEVQEYVREVAASTRVGDIRNAVRDALADQTRRGVFWSKVLSSRFYDYQREADNAMRAAGIPVRD